MALYMAFNLFNAITCIINTKKVPVKILYILYCICNIGCIILTSSRSVIILIGIIALVAFIIKYRKKITKKTILIIILALCIMISIIFVLMQFSKPVNVYDKEKEYEIRSLEPNKEYIFEFDIHAKTKDEQYNEIFGIEIIEVNRYLFEEKISEVKFSNYDGIKNIKIKASDDMSLIKVKFINKTKEEFIINKLNINSEEYILNYKYVSNSFARFFNTINFSTKSVWQRGDYYYDGFRILQDNWLIGGGGNTWRYSYEGIQEYYYGAKEVHSYLLEIWMSFGLLGIISFLCIIGITIKNIIKMIKEKKYKLDNTLISIIIGTFLILLHSFIDFNMSFLIILIMIYMLIAIINQEDKTIKYNNKIVDYIIILVFIIATGLSTKDFYVNTIVEDNYYDTQLSIDSYSTKYQYKKIQKLQEKKDKSEEEKKEILNRIKKYIELEPNMNQQYLYHIYTEQLIELLNENKIEEQKENIEYILDLWKNKENNKKFVLYIIVERGRDIEKLINKLEEIYKLNSKVEIKEYINEVGKIFIEQYPTNYKIIKDYKRNKSSKNTMKNKVEEYNKIYNIIIEKINDINGKIK